MKRALLIIDVQNDYFEGGRNELVHTREATLNIQELITEFRAEGEPVIYIQHINTYPNASFFIDETDGIKISELIAPLSSDTVIVKHCPDSFQETPLREHLERLDIRELVICGMMTHMCVDTTVRAARGLGYNVTLVEDACATQDLKWNGELIPADVVQKTYMASMNASFATICKTQDLIYWKS